MNATAFPSFNKSTDFEGWYVKIKGILATNQWDVLYDDSPDTPYTTTDSSLTMPSKLLYSKLKMALKGVMEKKFCNNTCYNSKCLEFLQAIKTVCKPETTFNEKMTLKAKFAQLSCKPGLSIDDYGTEVEDLVRDLNESGVKPHDNDIRLVFIFGLDHTFQDIHNHLSHPVIPSHLSAWNSTD